MTPFQTLTPRWRISDRASALAIGSMLVALMITPTVASAAPATHLTEHDVRFGCDVLSGEGADAYFAPWFNSSFGSDAQLQLWLHPDNIIVDPPTALSGSTQLVVAVDDSSLTGTFDVLMGSDVVGTGTLDAHLDPIGDVVEITFPKSASNQKHREYQVIQPVAVSGTLRISLRGGDIVMPLDGCAGTVADFFGSFNDPAAGVAWADRTEIFCALGNEDMTVTLNGAIESGLTVADVIVTTSGDTYLSNDDGTATTLTRSRFGTTQDLLASGGAGLSATGGSVTAAADLRIQPRTVLVERFDGGRYRLAFHDFAISGALDVTLDTGERWTFPLTSHVCQVTYVAERLFIAP